MVRPTGFCGACLAWLKGDRQREDATVPKETCERTMQTDALRERWKAAFKKIADALPYDGARPEDPALAVEYSSLALGRKFGPHTSPLIVLNGPPGAGKSTIGEVLEVFGLTRIPRVTTRAKRAGESDEAYRFITPQGFRRLEKDGKLLASKLTWEDRYGVLRADLEKISGTAYIEGGSALEALKAPSMSPTLSRDSILNVHILPPSLDAWLERLKNKRDQGHFDQTGFDERASKGLGYIERSVDYLTDFPRSIYLVADQPQRIAPLVHLLQRGRHQEICFSVDPSGAPEYAVTKEYAHEFGIVHPIVVVYVFDRNGRLLLQQRTDTKQWDHSAAGHLAVGEKPMEGAARELWEELGIKGTLVAQGEGFAIHPLIPAGHQHVFSCFSMLTDEPVNPDQREVLRLRFVTLQQLDEALIHDANDYSGGLHATYKWLKERMVRQGCLWPQ